LRNVGLTPPYFHHGGQATLEQVVEFYDRGGDRVALSGGADSTGNLGLPIFSANGQADASNLDPNIGGKGKNDGLGLSASDRAALVEFLKELTDNRVACHAGPFDHPELPLSVGLSSVSSGLSSITPARAIDLIGVLPATGKGGLTAEKNSQGPLPCFSNSGNLFGETQNIFKKVITP